MRPLTVLVLAGSPVDAFHADLSTVYAGGFLDALGGHPDHRIEIAFVLPGGRWCFPADVAAESVDAAPTMSLSEAMVAIEALEVDLMVPQMFCRPGMTTYRSLFDLMGIPHLGNTADVMAMTARKDLARAVVAAAGVDVPFGEVVEADGAIEVPLPVVVKPVDADNSTGVTLVRDSESLDAALEEALRHSEAALVETYVPLGREVRCGILEIDGELVCLPLEEYAVDEQGKPVRDHADKLDRTASGDLFLVAKERSRAWPVDVDDSVTEPVWAAARIAHRALGCRHYSLFDFRVDPDGRPWFLEASLYCSYAPSSVLAVMADAAGITVPELFALSVREALPQSM